MENPTTPFLKGRGAQINPADPYAKLKRDAQPVDWELAKESAWADDFDWQTDLKTESHTGRGRARAGDQSFRVSLVR